MNWARHPSSPTWHLIAEVAGGAVRSRCWGSWHASDTYETTAYPPFAERCTPCQAALRADNFAELAHVSTANDWPSAHEFDLGGEG